MYTNNVEFRVLIKGKPVTEYFHRGQNFIEGRAGSNYEIEFRNNNAFRVEAIISVDGLSVTDGKTAGPASSGYLVNAHDTVRIPGWKVDDAMAAAFCFSGKQESYATGVASGDSRNNGVIGAMVYGEQVVRPAYQGWHGVTGSGYNGGPMFTASMNPNSRSYSKSASPMGGGLTRGMSSSINTMASAASLSASASPFIGASFSNAVQPESAAPFEIGQYFSGNADAMSANAPNVVEQSLGTGFGEATDFRTTTVQFNRADLLSVMVLYYDDLRGLKSRGVVIGRRGRGPVAPQAFPGAVVGCRPPEGWKA